MHPVAVTGAHAPRVPFLNHDHVHPGLPIRDTDPA